MINDPTDPSLLDPLKAELLTTTRRSNEVRGKADRAVREAQLVEDDASVLKVFAEELNPLVLDAMDVAESKFAYTQKYAIYSALLQDMVFSVTYVRINQDHCHYSKVLWILSRKF